MIQRKRDIVGTGRPPWVEPPTSKMVPKKASDKKNEKVGSIQSSPKTRKLNRKQSQTNPAKSQTNPPNKFRHLGGGETTLGFDGQRVHPSGFSYTRICSLDTETTGSHFQKGSRAFTVSIVQCDANYENLTEDYFEWNVNPFNRAVVPKLADLERLYEILNQPNTLYIMHNKVFDIRALCALFHNHLTFDKRFDADWFLEHSDCTLTMYHVLDNKSVHALKPVTKELFGFPIEDETELLDLVDKLRSQVPKTWAIASNKNPKSCPWMLKAPSKGWRVLDMWLPRAYRKRLHKKPNPNLPPTTYATKARFDIDSLLEKCKTYAMNDALRCLILHRYCVEQLALQGFGNTYALRNENIQFLFHMESQGLDIDLDKTKEMMERIRAKMDECNLSINRMIGYSINLDSHQQLALLFNNLGFILPVTESGGSSTNKDAVYNVWTLLLQQKEVGVSHRVPQKNPKLAAFSHDDLIQLLTLYLTYDKLSTKLGYFHSYVMAANPCLALPNGRKANVLGHSVYVHEPPPAKKDGKANNLPPENTKAHRKIETFSWSDVKLFHQIHANFNLTGTKTTRFSCSGPNLQNIDKGEEPFFKVIEDIVKEYSGRKCFGPRPGTLWLDIDYRQLQLVIFAHLSKEQKMIDAVNKGMDFHDFMARKIFGLSDTQTPDKGQRRIAKAVNFGFIFGSQPNKIEMTCKKPGLWNTLTKLFPNAIGFLAENKAKAERDGYVTVKGHREFPNSDYRLHTPDPTPDKPYSREYAATCYLVQGTEGLIVQEAMRLTHQYLWSLRHDLNNPHLCTQVHDELIYSIVNSDLHYVAPTIVDLMVKAGESYNIKLNVDPSVVLRSWAEAIPYSPDLRV